MYMPCEITHSEPPLVYKPALDFAQITFLVHSHNNP